MLLLRSSILSLAAVSLFFGGSADAQAIAFDDDEIFSDACQAASQVLYSANPELVELQAIADEAFNFTLDNVFSDTPDPEDACQANEEKGAIECTVDFSTNTEVPALVSKCNELDNAGIVFYSLYYDCDLFFFRFILNVTDIPVCVPAECGMDLINLKIDPGMMEDDTMDGDVMTNETVSLNCTDFTYSLTNINGEAIVDENGDGPGELILSGGTGGGGTDNGGTDNGGTDNGGTDNGGTDNGGTDNGGTDNGGTDNGGTDNGGTDGGGSSAFTKNKWYLVTVVSSVIAGLLVLG